MVHNRVNYEYGQFALFQPRLFTCSSRCVSRHLKAKSIAVVTYISTDVRTCCALFHVLTFRGKDQILEELELLTIGGAATFRRIESDH